VLFVIQQSAVVAEQVRPDHAQRVVDLAEEMCRAWELLMRTIKEAVIEGSASSEDLAEHFTTRQILDVMEVAVNDLVRFCISSREGER
jgi:hypothetical protein